jgi:hypothetical protein
MNTTVKKNEAKSQAKAADVKIEAKAAPQQTAPVAPAAPKAAPAIGQADLTSKRLSQVALTEYRIVPSQRKSFKGYYIQGGTMRHDSVSNRDLFAVCVEIPHTDLAAAKTQLAALKAEAAKAAQLAPAAAAAPVSKAKTGKKAA